MGGEQVRRWSPALAVVAPLAGCAGSAEAPSASAPLTQAPSTTGELTAEEACLNAHALSVQPARRVGKAVRVTFGDGAQDPEPVLYRVHRRPADRSTPWTVVAELRRPPATAISWTDAAAPAVALLYGVTV